MKEPSFARLTFNRSFMNYSFILSLFLHSPCSSTSFGLFNAFNFYLVCTCIRNFIISLPHSSFSFFFTKLLIFNNRLNDSCFVPFFSTYIDHYIRFNTPAASFSNPNNTYTHAALIASRFLILVWPNMDLIAVLEKTSFGSEKNLSNCLKNSFFNFILFIMQIMSNWKPHVISLSKPQFTTW